MPGLRFSVPYNNQFGTLEALAGRFGSGRNRVSEVYFSPPGELFGSGRIVPRTSFADVERVVGFCHEHGWGADLVLNSTCGGLDWYRPDYVSAVIKYLKKLHVEHGLDSVTLANPLYIQKIRKELPKIKIVASAFADIESVQRAMFYDKLGADVINPNGINRDLEKLAAIKEAIEGEVRIMANEGCLLSCPYRVFHNNYTSHRSQENTSLMDLCGEQCRMVRRIDPSQILKSDWVRPEDAHKYRKITGFFKIVGRTMPTEWICNATSAYLNEKYAGNLLELIESSIPGFIKDYNASVDNRSLPGFFERVTSCSRNCHKCKYCDRLAKKIVRFRG